MATYCTPILNGCFHINVEKLQVVLPPWRTIYDINCGTQTSGFSDSMNTGLILSVIEVLHILTNNNTAARTNCPLSSDRQRLSYDVCLEVRWEIMRTVLFCIVYW